ncbi:hypothetical protein V1478_016187 [Vespula squamosa]|uniref:Uncharacterized protein n=1 Tax=Vespula squamosa TaxID=30214 RepID=A0ABD2A1S1_VESSQ
MLSFAFIEEHTVSRVVHTVSILPSAKPNDISVFPSNLAALRAILKQFYTSRVSEVAGAIRRGRDKLRSDTIRRRYRLLRCSTDPEYRVGTRDTLPRGINLEDRKAQPKLCGLPITDVLEYRMRV